LCDGVRILEMFNDHKKHKMTEYGQQMLNL
jgi:hypothetical protein